ncbi:hypothetical protein Tco_0371066 [Tanacetum coccineum]
MANGEDCLDGCDGAGGGEVKGGGFNLGVVNSLLGEIPKDVMAFGSMRPRPNIRRLNGSILRGLVRIAAMLSSEETFSIEMFPFWTLSRGSDVGFLYVWYENRERGSYLAFSAETYSASVVEMARAVCFLENHDVRQHLMNVHTPLVLLRST